MLCICTYKVHVSLIWQISEYLHLYGDQGDDSCSLYHSSDKTIPKHYGQVLVSQFCGKHTYISSLHSGVMVQFHLYYCKSYFMLTGPPLQYDNHVCTRAYI